MSHKAVSYRIHARLVRCLTNWPGQALLYRTPASLSSGVLPNFACLVSRARHAAILSQQRGHVFRPQSCLLLKYYYIWCGYTSSRHRDLNTFWIFSGPWGSILRCREAIKLSCAQLCKTGCFRESKSSSDFVTFWLSVYTCYIFLSIFALIKESFGESDSDFKSVSLHIYLKICI